MTVNDLHEFCKHHEKVYCYGAGKHGRTTLIHLQENGLDIDSFLVTKKTNVDEVLGKPLNSIKNMKLTGDIGIILAVGSRFINEMKKELYARNITDFIVVDEMLLSKIEAKTHFDVSYDEKNYVNVLMYHRVVVDSTNIYGINVSPENFDSQMEFLKNNFRILRFDEDWSSVEEPSVVVTFDDGYADNFENALPIIEKYGIPATVFITTGNIDTKQLFWWDYLEGMFSQGRSAEIHLGNRIFSKDELANAHSFLHDMHPEERNAILASKSCNATTMPQYVLNRRSLTVDELKRMAESPFITIGAHTVTHSSLPCESYETQDWEIFKSREYLEKILGCKVDTFSYPFGDYNENTLSILAKYGFTKACTVDGGLAQGIDRFLIPRNRVGDLDAEGFEKFLKQCRCIYTRRIHR